MALPDWRDGAAYRALLGAERPAFAWEWLRRLPAYRAAALNSLEAAHKLPPGPVSEDGRALRWALHVFEDPNLAVPEARPIWSSSHMPFVLKAMAEPCAANEDALMIERVSHLATLILAPAGQRLLLSDGFRSIRVDVDGASLLRGPVVLRYDLRGFAALDGPLLVLRRLHALVATGEFSRTQHQSYGRARRHVLLLRTHDALVAGVNQRAIAAELLASRAAQQGWRLEAASLRSQVQRLVQGARRMAKGGFWELLR